MLKIWHPRSFFAQPSQMEPCLTHLASRIFATGATRRDNHGQKVQGPPKRNVEINKQITVCEHSRDLCTLIDAHAAEFNHETWRLPFNSSCRAFLAMFV